MDSLPLSGFHGPQAASVDAVSVSVSVSVCVCVDHRLITPVIAGLLQTAEHRLLIDKTPLGLVHSKTQSPQKNSGY